MKKYRIGIDACGTKVAYGVFDENDALVYRHEHPTDIEAAGPKFSDELIFNIHEILSNLGIDKSELHGIGICMPSFILHEKGYICITSAMTNIRDFPMRDYFFEKLGVPIFVDNDGNVAALAEHRHGAGKKSRHMVYMAVSTGIGSGIIINEELFHGSYGWAGECGHMIAGEVDTVECGCENSGCFMSYASGRYIVKHAKKRIGRGEKSILSEVNDMSAKDILDAYHKNDSLAVSLVEQMGRYIGTCVFNIYQLLNINLFVFGGGLTNFGDVLFDKVRKTFDTLNHIDMPVEFRFAELKTDFGIIGAAELTK